jgi:hypothetical protein
MTSSSSSLVRRGLLRHCLPMLSKKASLRPLCAYLRAALAEAETRDAAMATAAAGCSGDDDNGANGSGGGGTGASMSAAERRSVLDF